MERLFGDNNPVGAIVNYLIGFLPIILGIVSGIVVYKIILKYARKHLGVDRIDATYIDDGERKGFSLEYKGQNYFVGNVYTGVNVLNNGQKYKVYIDPNNPNNISLYNNKMGAWGIAAMAAAVLLGCAICAAIMELANNIC